MVKAFAAGLIIAVIAPLIGNFLVVKRFSLLADTLAHVSLVGVAIGLLTGLNPLLVATGTSVIAALGMEKLRSKNKVLGEAALALFLSGSLAVAAVLVSLARGFNSNLLSFLFGSITTITTEDIYVMAILGVVVLVLISLFYKEFFIVSFDEELAKASGVKIKFFNNLLIILAAITVSVAMRIVGILLVGALMVIPVITASRIGKSFKSTLLISLVISLIAVIGGLFISYYLDLVSGGTIVIVALIMFLISIAFTRH